jgi:hypothetical protein
MADLYPQKAHLPAGPLGSPDFSRIPYESIHEKYYYYVQVLDNVPAPTRGSKTPKTPKPPTEYVGQVTEKEDSFITFKPIYRRTQGRAWSTLDDPSDETFFSLAIDLSDDQIPTGYATPFFRRVSSRPGATPNAYSRNMSSLIALQRENVGLVGMIPFVTPRSKSKTRKCKKSRHSRTRRNKQRGSGKHTAAVH